MVDTVLPIITDIVFDPEVVDVSPLHPVVDIIVSYSDDNPTNLPETPTGVSEIDVQIFNAINELIYEGTLTSITGGDAIIGTMTISALLPQYTLSGTCTYTVNIKDNANNENFYSYADLTELGLDNRLFIISDIDSCYACPGEGGNQIGTLWDESLQPEVTVEFLDDVNGDLLIAQRAEFDATEQSEFYSIWATKAKTTGKWYWEYKIDIAPGDTTRAMFMAVGIGRNTDSDPFNPPVSGIFSNGDITDPKTVYRTIGQILAGPGFYIPTASFPSSFIMGFKLDLDNHTLDMEINGIKFTSGNVNEDLPFTAYFPYIAMQRGRVEANFGSKSLEYPAPGFSPYNTSEFAGNATIGAIQDSRVYNINTALSSQKSASFGAVDINEVINTYELSYYSILNGQDQVIAPCVDDDIKIVPIIELNERASGRLKG